ncbi:MAG: response regulator [Desulfobacteraceae bacterium]
MEKERVLVVDDEEAVRRLMVRILSMEGYEVHTVQDGATALYHLEQKHFDLVVTDYKMPKMNGLEFAGQVRSRFPNLPIMVVTGDGEFPSPPHDGIAAYMKKPFNPYKLLDLVKKVLNQEANPD